MEIPSKKQKNPGLMAVQYDSFKKTCKNGYPQYYGVMIDPVTGVETQVAMNGEDWIAAGQSQGYESLSLGCPTAGQMVGGVQTYSRNKPILKLRTGSALVGYNIALGRRMGAPSDLVQQIKLLAPHRSYLLMEIRNAGGHVADPNSLYEIVAEYGRLHPELSTPDRRSRQIINIVPKSGDSGVDIGGIFGMVGDLVGGIVNGVNNANVEAFLSNWSNAFAAYMQTDFAAIRATLNATQANPGAWGGWGPKGALDMLLQFKNTSWKDLKNTITAYCEQNNAQIPTSVKQGFTDQEQLEQELRRAVAETNGAGTNNEGTTHGNSTGGSNNVPGVANFNFMKWLPWIIGVIVLLILIYVIFAMNKKKTKAA